jgi:hypothetical protein
MARPDTLWLHVALFPQLSVARQVRVAVKALPHEPLVTVLTITTGTLAPLATSMAMGLSKVHGARQLTTLFVAQVMTGAVVSLTVTVCVQLTLLLQPSATSQIRVAVNVGPQKPLVLVVVLTILIVTLVPTQLSVPIGVSKFQTAPNSTVLLAAHVTTGGVVSTAVTV